MELQKIIEEALEVKHTISYPIVDFTIESLIELADIAKKNKVELRIKKETSNFYCGTLLETQRFRDRIDCRRNDEK